MMKRPQTKELEKIVKELEKLDDRLLEAGLGVILKDTLQYTLAAPRKDDLLFKELISQVISEELDDKKYPPQWRLLYIDPSHPIPTGIAAAADQGRFNLKPLKQGVIIHEWTVYPARRFLKKFKVKLKKNICGKSGPYGQFKDGLVGQAALPTTIATTILTAGFTAATVWYPLAVYVGVLIVRTGLDVYCEKS
jgi:hypothetical protein